MLPAEFDYVRPSSLDEALAVLQERDEEARVLAGGHSILPMMKLRLARPGCLVDIGGLKDLSFVREDRNEIRIGALTTHHTVESSPLLRHRLPLLCETASQIGDVQVRNRGTIGGSLAHADPAADYPAALLALEARILAAGPEGVRTIPVSDFFRGMLTTALAPNEIITEVRIPIPGGQTGTAYLKAPHKASYFAIVGAAAIVQIEADGVCSGARIAITGAAFSAYRATAVEDRLTGSYLTDEMIADAAGSAADGRQLLSDIWASSDYRAHLCAVYARRAMLVARDRAREGA